MALTPPLHVPQVVQNLEKALLSADPEVEKLFLAAFGDVVLDPKYLHGDEAVQIVSASSSFTCAYTQKLAWFLIWDQLNQTRNENLETCVQEHSTYIGLLRELNADIRRRISQALVQVVSLPMHNHGHSLHPCTHSHTRYQMCS